MQRSPASSCIPRAAALQDSKSRLPVGGTGGAGDAYADEPARAVASAMQIFSRLPIQAVRVVARFMETHLERLQDDFDQLVLMALQKAWPCQ